MKFFVGWGESPWLRNDSVEGSGGGNDTPVAPADSSGEPEVATPAVVDAGGVEAGSPPQPTTPPAENWQDRRMAQLVAQRNEAREAKARLEAEVAELRAGAPTVPQAEIEQRAAALMAQRAFDMRCNEVAAAGRATFGEQEFNGSVGALRQLVDATDHESTQIYNTMLAAALETDAPQAVLMEMGKDLNMASRILGLSPVKQAVELTKLAARLVAPATPAKAAAPGKAPLPKPLTPVGQRGGATAGDPNNPDWASTVDTATWMKAREAALKAK